MMDLVSCPDNFSQDTPGKTSMNLLHPLASLEWRECCKLPVSVYNAQAVVLENKAYIGGGGMDPKPSSRLFIYDFTKNLWDKLDTPTQWYALTTYHSQLVLVGGVDPDTGEATNQLWVLNEQCHWTQPLPPMITERYNASAVNVGDCLIVAGGCSGDVGSPLNEVEVYDGHQWRQVQSLPRACSSMKSTVHEGNWYLGGGTRQGCKVYHTSLESLIATSDGAGQASVWKKLPDSPLEWSTLAVLRNQLITLGGGYNHSSVIHAYSPSVDSWVHVGDLPVACDPPSTVILPTGELLVVGTRPWLSSCLFRANVGVNLFPDGHFDMSSLDRLEKGADITIFNKLAPKFLEMALALDFDESTLDSLKIENSPVEGTKDMMEAWLSGESFLPPTWQVLLETLQAIEMGELVQEIEHFFNRISVTSPSLSLILESKKEELELDLSTIEKKELQTKPDCRDMGVQTHGEATASETTGYLRGVNVIAETSVLVTNQAQTFHWAGYGLKLHIPQGALPTGLKECRLLIKVGLSGQFALPQNTSLVSAVYWLDSEPRCTFSQPLTLEIQHCVKLNKSSRLSFVHAKCSQAHLPYEFKAVEGGTFSSESASGCIQRGHFSLLGIICNPFSLVRLSYNALASEVQLYRASLYYRSRRVVAITLKSGARKRGRALERMVLCVVLAVGPLPPYVHLAST